MASSEAAPAAAAPEKSVAVVGLDDSEHSYYALQWTLDHFFANAHFCPPLFSLVIVHAKPSPTSVVGLAGPGAADVLPFVETDLRKIAGRVVEKAKELCVSRSGLKMEDVRKLSGNEGTVTNVLVEVVEGDARNVLCEAVEKHQATMLVLGSHGYGAIKRAVLGSVSDYCAHHAHSTVMIVKKPKVKH
ncbi:hypothetical protein Taro_004295 [Colocasia esculenta]|uniref:UspA domain-containing protein n=1 Tax=Colocasia esculenta TaxID=4460 RepID=A0A843THS5_COLES|nr:hypothetical protein [Colocasia esculenta]